MNKRKVLSILTMIALIVTTVVPALGASGDGTGSAEWPANINISENTLETSTYQLGDTKEFQIGYYPANSTGAVIEADRHIEIVGPAEVTAFEFSEDKTTWKPISQFEGNIKITTTTIHKVRAAFHEEGEYAIRLWMTDKEGEVVKESQKNIYVSEEGIYVRPNAPTELQETANKLVFQWQYNANKEVKYNFYIDGEKVNTEAISSKQYDASEYADKFTPGVHKISVTSVLVKNSVVMTKVESVPMTIEYISEEQETETTTGSETTMLVETTPGTETTTPSETITGTETTTPSETITGTETTTPVETTTGSETTTPIETTTGSEVTTPVETTTGSETTAPVETTTEIETTTVAETTPVVTTTAKVTTKAPDVSKKIKLAKGKIIKASKKATAKKVKITFKKIRKAKFYEVQICRNKKFKKKNTIKKTVKRTNCTFKKLKAKKRYYVRVRAVAKVNGKKVFGKWSSKKRIKLKK